MANPLGSILGPLLGVAGASNPLIGILGSVVTGVLQQEMAQPTASPAAVSGKVVAAVTDAIGAAGATVAPTKSAWSSKINWVQLAGPAASLLAAWGLNLSADQIVGVVMAVQTVQSVVTWVMRTWFTKAVTHASAAK